ncbi:unnamed protein product [Rotaria sordida]|uniref:Uncharacterized protein n=1 Tax=Rotaria sordida TaxID=392033 RepID=A0A819VBS9_9BILA|nr:unnamed protein product [Rotaria sordida]CAF4106432.1 unnamed protein product [Rotaria sordida]
MTKYEIDAIVNMSYRTNWWIKDWGATRQSEALFNLSQLVFGLARAEQSNYTFRNLQLGPPSRQFREARFKKFHKHSSDLF